MSTIKKDVTVKVVKEKKAKEHVVKKNKTIHLNYYQLELDKIGDKEGDDKRISDAFKSPPDKFKNLVRVEDDGKISLYSKGLVVRNVNLIYGTLIHTQHKDLPFTYNADLQMSEELKIEEEAGLGTPTSFLFDPEVNIVMIESVKNGVGIGSFCDFFKLNFSLEALSHQIVINPAEYEKLDKFSTITKVHFKIARLRGASPFKKTPGSIKWLIDGADTTGANIMEMTIGVGRSTKLALVLSNTRSLINELLGNAGHDSKDVKMLTVTGNADGFSDEVDLIKQRVKSEISVELLRKNSLGAIDDRYNELYSAYVENKKSLHDAYKAKQKTE